MRQFWLTLSNAIDNLGSRDEEKRLVEHRYSNGWILFGSSIPERSHWKVTKYSLLEFGMIFLYCNAAMRHSSKDQKTEKGKVERRAQR
jgi:hypothetical protein